MKKLASLVVLLVIFSLTVIPSMAADTVQEKMAEEMPLMGPPEQMKELAFLEGTWDVKGKFRMAPDSAWQEYSAVSTYTYILDGAALRHDFHMPWMGMEMTGLGLQCYDRETQEWQAIWSDNFGGRLSLYSGFRKNGKTVLLGEDKMGGQTFLTRITSWDETDTSFQWTMEHSMDGGKSWYTSMDAAYTKK